MRRPPLIRDDTALRKELLLVEALGDIEVAIQILKKEDGQTGGEKLHPIDRHYKSMECDLKPLEADSTAFAVPNDSY